MTLASASSHSVISSWSTPVLCRFSDRRWRITATSLEISSNLCPRLAFVDRPIVKISATKSRPTQLFQSPFPAVPTLGNLPPVSRAFTNAPQDPLPSRLLPSPHLPLASPLPFLSHFRLHFTHVYRLTSLTIALSPRSSFPPLHNTFSSYSLSSLSLEESNHPNHVRQIST